MPVLTLSEADALAAQSHCGEAQPLSPTSPASHIPAPAPFLSRSPANDVGSVEEVKVLEAGRHSWEVLRECGLAPEEITQLAKEGVVGGIVVAGDKAKL